MINFNKSLVDSNRISGENNNERLLIIEGEYDDLDMNYSSDKKSVDPSK
jgi:hypothetical protein